MYKKYFRLDLEEFDKSPVFTIKHNQESSRMEMHLIAGGQAIDLGGCRVKIKANQPDGKSIFKNCGIIPNKKGRVYLDLVRHFNTFDVRLPCELKVYGTDDLLRSSTQFFLVVSSPNAVNSLALRGNNLADEEGLSTKVRVIAHRGLSSLAPENTLPAYHLAGKYGFWGGECDIHQTLDGEFILMHDESLNRMTNGHGTVRKYKLNELKQLVIHEGNGIENYPYLKIPTLTEYLQICKLHGLVPVIEIKDIEPDSVTRLLNLISQWGNLQNVIIITFKKEVATEVRMKSKEVGIQWLADLTRENIDYCAAHGMQIDSYKKTLSKELIDYAHSVGILVNTWTVDSGEDMQDFIEMGVDFISTNVLMHQHDLRSSGLCKSYLLSTKKDYERYLHKSLTECQQEPIVNQSWKWDEAGAILEMKGNTSSKEMLEIRLPKIHTGDVVTISFDYFNRSGTKIKAGLEYIEGSGATTVERSIQTNLSNDWGHIETQFITLHDVNGDDEYYKALIGTWSLSASHFRIRNVRVKIDFM